MSRRRLRDAEDRLRNTRREVASALEERTQLQHELTEIIRRRRREWTQRFVEEMKHAERMMRRRD